MAISTNGELKTALTKWLNRIESDTDLVPMIPDFIALAEAEMDADLDVRLLQEVTPLAELNTTAALPIDYSTMIGVWLHDSTGARKCELRYQTEKQIADLLSSQGDGGDPHVYTIVGNNINFFPTGQDADPKWQWQMTYNMMPSLDPADDSDTNIILTKAPNVYLYGALIHTAPFLDEDGRIATWKSLYDSIVRKVNHEAIYSQAGTAQIGMPEGSGW